MTAREWTIVALRALLSLVLAGLAVAAMNHGGVVLGLGLVPVCTVGAVFFGLVAYARYHDFRWRAQMRRYADE